MRMKKPCEWPVLSKCIMLSMSMATGMGTEVRGDVVINMPPPAKLIAKSTSHATSTQPAVSSPTSTSVGRVALYRFSRARYGSYDTYFNFIPRNYNTYLADNWGNPWFFGFQSVGCFETISWRTTCHPHATSNGGGTIKVRSPWRKHGSN